MKFFLFILIWALAAPVAGLRAAEQGRGVPPAAWGPIAERLAGTVAPTLISSPPIGPGRPDGSPEFEWRELYPRKNSGSTRRWACMMARLSAQAEICRPGQLIEVSGCECTRCADCDGVAEDEARRFHSCSLRFRCRRR